MHLLKLIKTRNFRIEHFLLIAKKQLKSSKIVVFFAITLQDMTLYKNVKCKSYR